MAVKNYGAGNAAGIFYVDLYLDETRMYRWTVNGLLAEAYDFEEDIDIGVVSAGWHTLKVVADATNSLAESGETDNVYQRSLYWQPPVTATPPPLSSPPDGTRLDSLGTTLTWANPPGTTHYHIQVLPVFNDGPAINLVRNAETSYTVIPPVFGQGPYVMLPGMTYSWRVRATSKATFAPEDDPSWGPWSELRTFQTPAPLRATISLLFPAAGATVGTGSQILHWDNSASDIFYYEVQVSPDAKFGEAGAVASVWHNLVHGGVSNPLNSWQTPSLQPNAVYYWRVRPRIQGDGTPVAWSPTWSFRTGG